MLEWDYCSTWEPSCFSGVKDSLSVYTDTNTGILLSCSSTWKRYHNFSFVCQESVQDKSVDQGVLNIYTNHPAGNLVHKNKTIKFDVLGE